MNYGELLDLFRRAGADDPEGWARSELEEGMPQLARFCLLRRLWPELIDRWLDASWIDEQVKLSQAKPQAPFGNTGPLLQELLGAGASRSALGRLARFVAYSTVFDLLYRLDYGRDEKLDDSYPDKYPGWSLAEVVGEDNEPTGRALKALHEDLLAFDPSGREGRPPDPGAGIALG